MKLKLLTTILILTVFNCVNATELINLEQKIINTEILITPQFNIEISDKIKDAIDSGIVITFVIQTRLLDQVDWWFDSELSMQHQTFQLRYFSLSRQFQLHNIKSKTKQNFANLDLLITELSKNTQFIFSNLPEADYIETRIFLDKQALPSTMQLPIVFDQDWNINSNWRKVAIVKSQTAQ